MSICLLFFELPRDGDYESSSVCVRSRGISVHCGRQIFRNYSKINDVGSISKRQNINLQHV